MDLGGPGRGGGSSLSCGDLPGSLPCAWRWPLGTVGGSSWPCFKARNSGLRKVGGHSQQEVGRDLNQVGTACFQWGQSPGGCWAAEALLCLLPEPVCMEGGAVLEPTSGQPCPSTHPAPLSTAAPDPPAGLAGPAALPGPSPPRLALLHLPLSPSCPPQASSPTCCSWSHRTQSQPPGAWKSRVTRGGLCCSGSPDVRTPHSLRLWSPGRLPRSVPCTSL